MKLVECVLNVSEGRDRDRIDQIAGVLRGHAACALLDVHSDWDHHRSVLTVAGEPRAVLERVLDACRIAVERIDLRLHHGVHPRIGAVDVVPFIPLQGLTLSECADLAREFARRIAAELDLPVFLYEEASAGPHRITLPELRRGGLEALFGPDAGGCRLRPDFGPPTPHATAGAVAVGARAILVAFNVLLATSQASLAREIARRIRQSNGGLPAVRALGLLLESRRQAQVSMNLIDYHITPPLRVVEAIRRECDRLGIGIDSSELVGLAPRAALPADPAGELLLKCFGPCRVLEARIFEELGVELQL
ncbi:MAG: glutamate formimidoyltransferase [Acidobacteriota bacterium]